MLKVSRNVNIDSEVLFQAPLLRPVLYFLLMNYLIKESKDALNHQQLYFQGLSRLYMLYFRMMLHFLWFVQFDFRPLSHLLIQN